MNFFCFFVYQDQRSAPEADYEGGNGQAGTAVARNRTVLAEAQWHLSVHHTGKRQRVDTEQERQVGPSYLQYIRLQKIIFNLIY